MKEVVIATQNDGPAVREVVALVDQRSLDKAGITEDVFRDEVLNVYAAEILKFTVGEALGEFFAASRDSGRSQVGNSKRSLHQVRSKAMQLLLDEGVRVEIRRIEDGKVSVVTRLTITSTGIIEGESPGPSER